MCHGSLAVMSRPVLRSMKWRCRAHFASRVRMSNRDGSGGSERREGSRGEHGTQSTAAVAQSPGTPWDEPPRALRRTGWSSNATAACGSSGRARGTSSADRRRCRSPDRSPSKTAGSRRVAKARLRLAPGRAPLRRNEPGNPEGGLKIRRARDRSPEPLEATAVDALGPWAAAGRIDVVASTRGPSRSRSLRIASRTGSSTSMRCGSGGR